MANGNANEVIKILIVDDDDDMLNLLEIWLSDKKRQIIRANTGVQALKKVALDKPDMVITDLYMDEMDGMVLLETLHNDDPLLPVIMLSGSAQIPDAIRAMHLGTCAFLTKPVAKTELIDTVEKNLPRNSALASLDIFSQNIVYQSKVMSALVETAAMVAKHDVSVFLSGATGTGKEVVAKAIHQASERKDKRFIGINCGAIPEQLLESELFGHEKGAFSGANIKHEGLFVAANGGTIFLDEIGDMPLALQVKLLRVLEDFQVRPVGSTKSFPIDVRIISATHQNLENAVENGTFRKDLYYRLKVVPIHLPDLKDRADDVPLLLDHFLYKFASHHHQSIKKFSVDAVDYLCTLPWPGNIRQLMNVVDLCATLSKNKIISLDHVKRAVQDDPIKIKTLKEAKFEFELNYLDSVMRITHGNVANAAKVAGRNRTEFYKLLSQYEINPSDYRQK